MRMPRSAPPGGFHEIGYVLIVLAALPAVSSDETVLGEIAAGQSAAFRTITSLNARATIAYTPVELAHSDEALRSEPSTTAEHFRLSGPYWRKDSGVDLSRDPGQLDYSASIASFDGEEYQLFSVDRRGLFVDRQRPIIDPYCAPPASVVPYGFAYDSQKEYAFQALSDPQHWERLFSEQNAAVLTGSRQIGAYECIAVELYPPGALFSDGKPKYRKVYFAPEAGYFPVCYETYFMEGPRNIGYRMTVNRLDRIPLESGPLPAVMGAFEEYFREDGKLLFTMNWEIERGTFAVNGPVDKEVFTVPKVFAQVILDRNDPQKSIDISPSSVLQSLERRIDSTAESPTQNPPPSAKDPGPSSAPAPPAHGPNVRLPMALSALLVLGGAVVLFGLLRRRPRSRGSS